MLFLKGFLSVLSRSDVIVTLHFQRSCSLIDSRQLHYHGHLQFVPGDGSRNAPAQLSPSYAKSHYPWIFTLDRITNYGMVSLVLLQQILLIHL